MLVMLVNVWVNEIVHDRVTDWDRSSVETSVLRCGLPFPILLRPGTLTRICMYLMSTVKSQ
jgi:hypothetical protein